MPGGFPSVPAGRAGGLMPCGLHVFFCDLLSLRGTAVIDPAFKACLLRYISSRGEDFQRAELPGTDTRLHLEPEFRFERVHTCFQKAVSPKGRVLDALKKAERSRDESFTEALVRLIREKGMSHAECYRRAGIDRKLFSKIQKDVHYRPSRKTAFAFALALELNEEEAREFLARAGYALSKSDAFDLVIEYCIRAKIYDVMLINEYLLELDLPLLGA